MIDQTDIALPLTDVASIDDVVFDGLSFEISLTMAGGVRDVVLFARDEGPEQLLVVVRDDQGVTLGLGYAPAGETVTEYGLLTVLDTDAKAMRMGRHALRNALAAREARRVRRLRSMRHAGDNAGRRLAAMARRVEEIDQATGAANDDQPLALAA